MYRDFIKFLNKPSSTVFRVLLLIICLMVLYLLYIIFNLSEEKGSIVQQKPATHAASSAEAPTTTPVLTSFEEGKHYQRLPATVTSNKTVQQLIAENPGKIQVIEFFNYGCFWCQQLHPVLNEWVKKKPDNVVFYRYPVIFNKYWEVLSKAYYMVKALGKNDALDAVFFTEVHQNRANLADEKILEAFFMKHGVSEKEFTELYHSFAINSEVTKANEIGDAYQVTLSPSVVINTPTGSYFSTATMTGGDQNLLALIDYLIKRDSKQENN